MTKLHSFKESTHSLCCTVALLRSMAAFILRPALRRLPYTPTQISSNFHYKLSGVTTPTIQSSKELLIHCSESSLAVSAAMFTFIHPLVLNS